MFFCAAWMLILWEGNDSSRFVTILNYIWPWSTRMRIFETKDVCVFSSISDKIRWFPTDSDKCHLIQGLMTTLLFLIYIPTSILRVTWNCQIVQHFLWACRYSCKSSISGSDRFSDRFSGNWKVFPNRQNQIGHRTLAWDTLRTWRLFKHKHGLRPA